MSAQSVTRRWLLLALVLSLWLGALAPVAAQPKHAQVVSGDVSGELRVWHPMTIDFTGPQSSELSDDPNPFLDYRLQVTFTGPDGQAYVVPGFFAGDGNGGESGDVWRVRFTPDQAGEWTYHASFRSGTHVAIDLDAAAGSPAGFDGAAGSFTVAERDPNAPDFLRWGRLEYVGGHYLKFRDGPYWIKGGTDSPETLLGYTGFDDTPAGPYGTLDFTDHVNDWNAGDPVFNTDSPDGGKGLIGALNYLSSQNVNSIYFLVMNIGGDGQNAFPYSGSIDPSGVADNDNTQFDLSKLRQWELAFDHAQQQGLHLHVVLGEAEEHNKKELDEATLGVERKLFYREMVARFGHHNAVQWNISEEYDHAYSLPSDVVKQFAGYIQDVDPYDHPITVHNQAPVEGSWRQFVGDSRFSMTSFQVNTSDLNHYEPLIEEWRDETADASRPLPISLDELNDLGSTETAAEQQRKEVIWPVYLSGGMIEHYLGGPLPDKQLDNFRSYESVWTYTSHARAFLEDYLPYWEMEPQDGLLSGESNVLGDGEVFAKPGEVYAVYLPSASSSGSLDLSGTSGSFEQRWYSPRTGSLEGDTRTVAGGGTVDLGTPPGEAADDWAVLLTRSESGDDPGDPPEPPDPEGPVVTGFVGVESGQALTGTVSIEALVEGDDIASVVFELGGPTSATWTEDNPPYFFMGNDPETGEPYGWDTAQHPDGSYVLTATATDQAGQTADAQISFSIGNDAASGTPDTKPPVISNVQTSNITDSTATITWTTDEDAGSQVEYGTSTVYGSTTGSDSSLVTGHLVHLEGLTPSTTYYYQVHSIDGAGNQSSLAGFSFTTAEPGSSGPAVPTVTGVEDGQIVTGTVAIEALPADEDVVQVVFELSGPQEAVWTENYAPYFFLGDDMSTGQPYGWDTTQYPDGEYSLTVTAINQAGERSATRVRFQVANAAQSDEITITGVQEGQALAGTVVIEVLTTITDAQHVEFVLDGPRPGFWIEENPPYYFMGNNRETGEVYGWDTTQHPDGAYTLTVTVFEATGQEHSIQVRFLIANSG